MGLAVRLIESGWGDGNLQKVKVLDTTMHAGQYLYPLDKTFEKANLLQVDCVLTLPAAIAANFAHFCGFCDTTTPNTTQQQIFSIGYRNGQTKNVLNVIMPSTDTPVGYWVLNGSSGYSLQTGVCYGRYPPNTSTYFCIKGNADTSTFEGARLEIYVTHKL